MPETPTETDKAPSDGLLEHVKREIDRMEKSYMKTQEEVDGQLQDIEERISNIRKDLDELIRKLDESTRKKENIITGVPTLDLPQISSEYLETASAQDLLRSIRNVSWKVRGSELRESTSDDEVKRRLMQKMGLKKNMEGVLRVCLEEAKRRLSRNMGLRKQDIERVEVERDNGNTLCFQIGGNPGKNLSEALRKSESRKYEESHDKDQERSSWEAVLEKIFDNNLRESLHGGVDFRIPTDESSSGPLKGLLTPQREASQYEAVYEQLRRLVNGGVDSFQIPQVEVDWTEVE